MLSCFRKYKKQIQPSMEGTIVHYSKDDIPHALMIEKGPGGSITLSNEEYLAIVKEVAPNIYVGASPAELSSKQILESKAFNQILATHNERSPLQSPRSHKTTKRK